MVQHHRPYGHHHPRKGDEEQQNQQACCDYYNCGGLKKARPSLLRVLLLFCIASCTLVFGHRLLFGGASSRFPFSLYSFGAAEQEEDSGALSSNAGDEPNTRVPCSSVPDNSICCDRTSSIRTDVCVLRGDVRTSASSIFLYSAAASSSSFPTAPSPSSGSKNHSSSASRVEKIRGPTLANGRPAS